MSMALRHLSRRISLDTASIPPLTFLLVPSRTRHLLFSTFSATPHFMVEYLVSTCGFSPAAAAKAAPRFAHLKSPAKPDSAIAFLRSQGLDSAQIRRVVSWFPTLLCSNTATLSPKFRAVRALGFDRADAARLFSLYPNTLTFGLHTNLLPRILFWLDLLGSTKLMLKWLRRLWLLKYSVDLLLQNTSTLRSYGISENQFNRFLRMHPALIMQGPGKCQALADRVEAWGIPRSSGMFMWGLCVLQVVSVPSFGAKKAIIMNLTRCTEQTFVAMFRRAPCFMLVSKKSLQRKVEFLKEKTRCGVEYLVTNPVLLTLSLEKRMVPRCRAIDLLQSKGVDIGKIQPGGLLKLPEAKFLERYILKHKDEVPELLEMYPPP